MTTPKLRKEDVEELRLTVIAERDDILTNIGLLLDALSAPPMQADFEQAGDVVAEIFDSVAFLRVMQEHVAEVEKAIGKDGGNDREPLKKLLRLLVANTLNGGGPFHGATPMEEFFSGLVRFHAAMAADSIIERRREASIPKLAFASDFAARVNSGGFGGGFKATRPYHLHPFQKAAMDLLDGFYKPGRNAGKTLTQEQRDMVRKSAAEAKAMLDTTMPDTTMLDALAEHLGCSRDAIEEVSPGVWVATLSNGRKVQAAHLRKDVRIVSPHGLVKYGSGAIGDHLDGCACGDHDEPDVARHARDKDAARIVDDVNPRSRDTFGKRTPAAQPQTFQGTRGDTMLKGVRMRDVFEAVAKISWGSSVDSEARAQNVCCDIEKRMGIYPNIPKPRG